MGFHLGWIAIPENESEAWLKKVGLESTGEWLEAAEATFNLRHFPGWHVMVCNDVMHPLLQESVLPVLSAEGGLLYFLAEETSMTFTLSQWQNGEQQWRIYHEGSNRRDHLLISGTPPDPYPRIAAECIHQASLAENHDVDMYCEIPVRLGQYLTGFRYDDYPEDVDEGKPLWEALQQTAESPYQPVIKKRPWYRFW